MKRIILTSISILFFVSISAQAIKGKLVNSQNEPIPYVSIFVKEASTGTTSNEDGDFEIKVSEGAYSFVFQHLSYETVTKNINSPSENISIVMGDKAYDLPAALVDRDKEDPAYNIIRKAIGMAPFYKKQLNNYNSEIYIKGTLKIDKISALAKRMARKELNNIKIKEGETYLQESLSEIEYNKGKVNQKIVSVSNSFPEQVGELKLGMANYNIYEQNAGGMISPISTQAFSYYKFKYEGFKYEGKHIVNKIKVTPKYKNAVSYTGYIFIAEELWNVHSFVLMNKQYGIEFTNKQTYGELAENIWMPISNNISANISIMGNKGVMDYISSIKYKNFVVNPQIKASLKSGDKEFVETSAEVVKQSDKSKEYSKKIDDILNKNKLKDKEAYKLSNLIQKKEKEDKRNLPDSLKEAKNLNVANNYKIEVDSAAKKKDRVYWDDIRPIPLMKTEQISYKRTDSLKGIIIKNDTVIKTKRKAFSFGGIVFGNNYKVDSTFYIKHSGFINTPCIEYNVVDGWKYSQTLDFRKRFKDTSRLKAYINGSYAFARKQFLFNGFVSYSYIPEKQASIYIKGGNQSADFNFISSLNKFENSINSLFFRRNYQNYFNNKYIEVGHDIEVTNGFKINVALAYNNRERLYNNTDYSFFYKNSREFRANIPPHNQYVSNDNTLVDNQKTSIMSIKLTYTPEMYYYQKGKYKVSVRSKYPTFSLLWKKGIKNVFNSVSDFDQLEASINQTINLGTMETFKYNVVGGYFPNNKQMHFRDFKHFNIKEFELTFSPLVNNFNLLKTYMPSTNEWYASAYLTYTAPYLALKRLPLLNRTLIKENITLNYLNTPYLKNYTELGYSLTDISLVGSLGVYVGFEKFKYYNWGFKVSINF